MVGAGMIPVNHIGIFFVQIVTFSLNHQWDKNVLFGNSSDTGVCVNRVKL